jgi:hypothetical protein
MSSAGTLDASLVAVIVPFHRAELSDDERVSLLHLDRFLGSYERFLVMPEGLRAGLDGFGCKRFANRFFESRRGYSQLMLSREFYRSFSMYEYILVYQLDCLVFSDELVAWCEKGYDYIGAVHTIHGETMVGNGGFSLRRIPGFLAVLNSKKKAVDPVDYWNRNWAHRPVLERWRSLPRRYVKHFRRFNGVQWEIRRLNRVDYGWPEDWFWSLGAKKYWPSFRIAPNEAGLRFAFSEEPEEAFAMNGRHIPFGCHGWDRYGRQFWEQYLLPEARAQLAQTP